MSEPYRYAGPGEPEASLLSPSRIRRATVVEVAPVAVPDQSPSIVQSPSGIGLASFRTPEPSDVMTVPIGRMVRSFGVEFDRERRPRTASFRRSVVGSSGDA